MPLETLRTPIAKPDVIVADAGPLIHLAQADALGLLHQFGRVVVPDMVAFEVTQDLAKPGAATLRDWLAAGQAPGSTVKTRDAGERAIVDWLAEKVAGTDTAAVVIYENGKVPKIIANQAMDADIDVVTTRAFLQIAEGRQLVPSAEAYWARVAEAVPTANGANTVTMHRNIRA